jgi:hypothetical protein
MVFILLSAVGITALLFVGFYEFCHMILRWIATDSP